MRFNVPRKIISEPVHCKICSIDRFWTLIKHEGQRKGKDVGSHDCVKGRSVLLEVSLIMVTFIVCRQWGICIQSRHMYSLPGSWSC